MLRRLSAISLLALLGCRSDGPTDADIEALQDQIDDLGLALDAAQADLTAANERIATLEADGSGADARLDAMEASLGEVLDDTGLQSIGERVSGVEGELATLGDAVDTHEQALADLASADGVAQDDIADLQAADEAYGSRLDTLESAVSDLEASDTAHEATLSALLASDGALDTRLDAAELHLTGAQTDITSLESLTAAHEAALTGLDARLDAMDSTLAQHTTDLTTLDARADGLDTSVTSLSTTVSGHTTTLSGLSTTVSGHTTTLSGLSTTVSGHTTTLSALDTRATDLEDRADQTDLDIATLLRRTTVHRNTFFGSDQTDNGTLTGRSLTFTKVASSTTLRISYHDNFRVYNPTGAGSSCVWEVLVNGATCGNPGILAAQNHVGYVNTNFHRDGQVEGICKGIAAGTVTLQVVVYPLSGYPVADCYTGWAGAQGYLEAVEID